MLVEHLGWKYECILPYWPDLWYNRLLIEVINGDLCQNPPAYDQLSSIYRSGNYQIWTCPGHFTNVSSEEVNGTWVYSTIYIPKTYYLVKLSKVEPEKFYKTYPIYNADILYSSQPGKKWRKAESLMRIKVKALEYKDSK